MLPRSTTVFLPNLLIFPTIKFYLYCPNSWMFPLSLEHDRVIKGYTLWWILSSFSRELSIGNGLLARVKSEANPHSVLRFGLAHRLAHVLKMLSQQLWIPEFSSPIASRGYYFIFIIRANIYDLLCILSSQWLLTIWKRTVRYIMLAILSTHHLS